MRTTTAQMEATSPYTDTWLTKTVVLLPSQMDSNMLKNLLSNLTEDIEGKCYGSHGIVRKVYRRENLYGGDITAEENRAAAYYTVKFSCSLCKPEEDTIIAGKVSGVSKTITILRNGPINIFVPTKNMSSNYHIDEEENLIHKSGRNIEVRIDDTCKVRVLSVTMEDRDTGITVLGYLEDTG